MKNREQFIVCLGLLFIIHGYWGGVALCRSHPPPHKNICQKCFILNCFVIAFIGNVIASKKSYTILKIIFQDS